MGKNMIQSLGWTKSFRKRSRRYKSPNRNKLRSMHNISRNYRTWEMNMKRSWGKFKTKIAFSSNSLKKRKGWMMSKLKRSPPLKSGLRTSNLYMLLLLSQNSQKNNLNNCLVEFMMTCINEWLVFLKDLMRCRKHTMHLSAILTSSMTTIKGGMRPQELMIP